jgi:GT2 family glycosyltransferase
MVDQLEPSAWELLVVDNGSVDRTADVLAAYRDRLPITTLFESIAGKTRALNRALGVARGDLLVFTDDDVKVSDHWLREIRRSAAAYPQAAVFGGPIVPRFSEAVPDWLRLHPFAALAFTRFEPELREGPLPPPLLPFGPNFAVRSAVLNGMRFREDLGPAEDGLVNDETEFCKRLRRQREIFIFVPQAVVEHYIRPEQVSLSWLLERGHAYGRSIVVEENVAAQPHSGTTQESRLFDACMRLNIQCGALSEMLKSIEMDSFLDVRLRDGTTLLSTSSRRWLTEAKPID